MEQNPIYATVQELVRKGDTAQALQVFAALLERDPGSTELLRTLRVIEANYNAARQQELKGILAFSDAQRTYNQTNDALLSILDDLAAGRKPAIADQGAADHSRRIWFLGGAAVLLLGIVLGLWWRGTHQKNAGGTEPVAQSIQTAPASECPTFGAEGPRVLLLPFSSFSEGNLKPEILIKARITAIAKNNDFPISVEIFSAYDTQNDLPDDADVKPLGQRCEADLVVWGLYGSGSAGNAVSIETRYLFIGEEGRSGGTRLQSVPDALSIRSGKMFKSIDDVVFSVCSRLAYRMNRPALALKWLKKMNQLDPDEKKLLEMVEKKAPDAAEKK